MPAWSNGKAPGFEPGRWRFESFRGCCQFNRVSIVQLDRTPACEAGNVGSSPAGDATPSGLTERHRSSKPDDAGSSPAWEACATTRGWDRPLIRAWTRSSSLPVATGNLVPRSYCILVAAGIRRQARGTMRCDLEGESAGDGICLTNRNRRVRFPGLPL